MRLAILASHEGTTLQAVLDACSSGALAMTPVVVISNNPGSGALRRAELAGVTATNLSRRTHPDPDDLDEAIRGALLKTETELVFLAGFMRKLGPRVLAQYEGRILNTHPSLLPSHGGRGMYGRRVHEAVITSGDAESGVSMHLVDAEYDTGAVVAQRSVPVLPDDDADTLAERVRQAERGFVVEVLQRIATGQLDLPLG